MRSKTRAAIFALIMLAATLLLGLISTTPQAGAASPITWAVRTDLPVLAGPKPLISPDGGTITVVGQGGSNPVSAYLLSSVNGYVKGAPLGAGYDVTQTYNLDNGDLNIASWANSVISGRRISTGGGVTNWVLSSPGEELAGPTLTFCSKPGFAKYFLAARSWNKTAGSRPVVWDSVDGLNWAKEKELQGGNGIGLISLAVDANCNLLGSYNIGKSNWAFLHYNTDWSNNLINEGWDFNTVTWSPEGIPYLYYTDSVAGINYIGEARWFGGWTTTDDAVKVTYRVKSLSAVTMGDTIYIGMNLLDESPGNSGSGFYYADNKHVVPGHTDYALNAVYKSPDVGEVSLAARGNKLVATAWLVNHNTMLATANLPLVVPPTTAATTTAPTTTAPVTTAPPASTTPPAVSPPGTICAADIVLNEAPFPIKCKFADYYLRTFNGDLFRAIAFFGLPLGPESGGVQQFERQRFELHLEFTGTPYEVSLGLVNKERIAAEKKLADILAILKTLNIEVKL